MVALLRGLRTAALGCYVIYKHSGPLLGTGFLDNNLPEINGRVAVAELGPIWT